MKLLNGLSTAAAIGGGVVGAEFVGSQVMRSSVLRMGAGLPYKAQTGVLAAGMGVLGLYLGRRSGMVGRVGQGMAVNSLLHLVGLVTDSVDVDLGVY